MTMSEIQDHDSCCEGGCDHFSQYSNSQHSLMELAGIMDNSSPGECPTDGEASYAAPSHCSKISRESAAASMCRSGRSTLPSYSGRDSRTSPRNRRYETPHIPKRTDFGEYYPDGGWGWTVCGAAFVVHFLCQGFHLAAGTVFMEVRREYQASAEDAVWLGGLAYGISLLVCPLVIALCRRKSPRVCAIVGGLIACLGCLFMSFSAELHQLFVSAAVVVGLGTGVSMTTSGIMLGRYFSRRRESAEMLSMSGGGVGMALMSVFLKQTIAAFSWLRSMQIMVGVMFPTVIAGALYRSASLYHPRRRAILHIKNMRKSKKQQKEFENRPAYIDLSPLRMRAIQVLVFNTLVITLGVYVPFVLLPEEANKSGLDDKSTLLLMVFMGVAFAFGCLIFGLVVIRKSLHCMVARQYLLQIAAFGAGLCSVLFTMAQGFNAFSMYVWGFGFLAGGFYYSLKVYAHELSTMKLSERSWGYIALTQCLPTLCGPPLALYFNTIEPLGPRSGFVMSGIFMIFGSVSLFIMPWAVKHKSNHKVLQSAHLHFKMYEDDLLLYGMEVSDDLRHQNYMYPYTHTSFKRRHLLPGGKRLGLINEEDGWSDLEGLSPMSPNDKVTEFLVHSQTMLQNYSQLHHIDLPSVRLEINNEYGSPGSGGSDCDSCSQSHRNEIINIKDLKLEATLYRTSPKRKHRKKSVSKPQPPMTLNFHGGNSPHGSSNPVGGHSPDISPLIESVNPLSRSIANHINMEKPCRMDNHHGYRLYGNSMRNLQQTDMPNTGYEECRGPRPAKSVPLLVTCEKTTTV